MIKKAEFRCPTCGLLEYVLMEGYEVGDRVLLGVKFELSVVDGELSVSVREKDRQYFEQLNQGKWLRAAYECAKQVDIVTCPKCSTDVTGPWWFGKELPEELEC